MKWKTVYLSYLEFNIKECFNESQLNNFTYPLNFKNEITKNISEKSLRRIRTIEKNLSRCLLIYNKMLTFYNDYKNDDIIKYKYIVKTDLEHFMIEYRLAVSNVEKLKKEFKKHDIRWRNVEYMLKGDEFDQLINIRNNITHQSTRSHIFYFMENGTTAFQFYSNRELNNYICLPEFFLNPLGSEIYDLERWLTWRLNLLLCYFNDTFDDLKHVVIGDLDIEEINKYDDIVACGYSTITSTCNEIEILKDKTLKMKLYIENYNRHTM